MSPIVQQLNQINWFSKIDDERVFHKLGVHFGFQGKGSENFLGHSVKQVHGTKIVEAGTATEAAETMHAQADGIYSQKIGCVVGVQTADCLPVLLCTESKATVMAIHAGWRGLTAGIVTEGVHALRSLEPNSAIFASIGPAIGPCHYEVGPELVEALYGAKLGLSNEQAAFCLSPGKDDRWYLDLATASVFALQNADVSLQSISVFRSCTYQFPNLWHSFRRDGRAAERNWAWIAAS